MNSIYKNLEIKKFFAPNKKSFTPIINSEWRRNLCEISPNWHPKEKDAIYDAFLKNDSKNNKDTVTPFTELDLFSTNGIDKEDIIKRAREVFGFKEKKINKDQNIDKINEVYSDAVHFLEISLRRNIPKGLASKKWKNFDEFIEAIENHTKSHQNATAASSENKEWIVPIGAESDNENGLYSLFFCGILKAMIVEMEIRKSREYIEELDMQMANLVKKAEKIRPIKINGNSKTYSLEGMKWLGKFEYNVKSENSIKTKMVYKREYTSLHKFKDLIRMRFVLPETWTEKDYVNTVLATANLYEPEKLPELRIKWNILSPESIELIEKIGVKVIIEDKWDWSDINYRDMKFVGGTIDLWKGKWKGNISPEVQFVLANNKNEAGFSSHEIYDLKKVISANARFFGWLSVTGLVNLIRSFDLDIKEREIFDHLLFPQHGKSVPFLYALSTKRPDGSDKYYFTTSEVYEAKIEKNWEKESTKLSELHENYPKPINRQDHPDVRTYWLMYSNIIDKVQKNFYTLTHKK